uniref:Uncharacterized protein n=1 Tax=Parascaris univalens TaxID=6257 RepID=A0A915C9R3_PARUN
MRFICYSKQKFYLTSVMSYVSSNSTRRCLKKRTAEVVKRFSK